MRQFGASEFSRYFVGRLLWLALIVGLSLSLGSSSETNLQHRELWLPTAKLPATKQQSKLSFDWRHGNMDQPCQYVAVWRPLPGGAAGADWHIRGDARRDTKDPSSGRSPGRHSDQRNSTTQ